MPKIVIKNVNMGGLSDSSYMGAENSVTEMSGFDIHTKPGIFRVNQKLTKDSGGVVTEPIGAVVNTSGGNAYFFSSTTGKIWERTAGGSWSLVATNTNGGVAGQFDAFEYQQYVYYTAVAFIGRWQVGSAWSTRNDSWAALPGGVSGGMIEINNILYIASGNFIASIDTGVYTSNALDIQSDMTISAIGKLGVDLVFGATDGSLSKGYSNLYQWDTFSPSYSTVKQVRETVINSIMPLENVVLISAGYTGNFYTYDGVNVNIYKRLHIDSGIIHLRVKRNAWCTFNGRLHFVLSNVQNNTYTPMGVYSIGRSSRGYPLVMTCEMPVSITDAQYSTGVMVVIPNGNYFLVSWTTTGGAVSGVDVYDLNAKCTNAYVITRKLTIDRDELQNFKTCAVGYEQLPVNTDITIESRRNHGAFVLMASEVDAIRTVKETSEDISDTTILQMRISAPVVSGNSAPEIDQIVINVD